MRAALEAKGQHPCMGLGDCTGSRGQVPLCGFRGQDWQSQASTSVWVQGTALAGIGQYPCVGLGTALAGIGQHTSRGLHWQAQASTPVRVYGTGLAGTGQHISRELSWQAQASTNHCVGLGGCTGRHMQAHIQGTALAATG